MDAVEVRPCLASLMGVGSDPERAPVPRMVGVNFRFRWWKDAVSCVLLLLAVVAFTGEFPEGYRVAAYAEMVIIAAFYIFPVYWFLGRFGKHLPFPLPALFANYWNPLAVILLFLLVRSDPYLRKPSP
jgi:hypothetical protein